MDPQIHKDTGEFLRNLLVTAWLLPLAGFAVEIFGRRWAGRLSKAPAFLSVFCIGVGFLCSATALYAWGERTDWVALEGHHGAESGESESGKSESAESESGEEHSVGGHHGEHGLPPVFHGKLYDLARFGALKVSVDYYIDSLTLVMFTMVTLIATCIHIFAMGYMSDELTEDYVDHQVHTSSHGHFHRPGRFYRFFAFLSLFCFSMLGLVLAGNIFLVFVFWELVGVCSYFLIGFYVERKSASTAANKAFIMNRVGDFGFLIGLMIIWTHLGTFSFPDLFQAVRGETGDLKVIEGLYGPEIALHASGENKEEAPAVNIPYWLLVAAGLGIFAGCIGKSAQFPLQTWLPDAMEGPTPVSALVHSATMVAAGVYLTGRFYPLFLPEVKLVIAYIGCITLFMAATIAIVATDIKKVLAYSTISQLGYMMLGLGVGGWGAGLFHLITHAFFKSLMFLASGSVIHGCHHVQEMPQMGGLWRKMPITAFTMLVGVFAIAGLAVPGVLIYGEPIALSGYHSKDAIVATAMTFTEMNGHVLLFAAPLIGAGITAFYMFRLWFYTFAGTPRDPHVYDHAHESPSVMWLPLVVLSVPAALIAFGGESGILYKLIGFSEPVGVAHGSIGAVEPLRFPSHEAIQVRHERAGQLALFAALVGTATAYVFYGSRILDPGAIQRTFSGVYRFLVEKWHFDTLYDFLFVRPVHVISKFITAIDRIVFDGILHGACKLGILISKWDRLFDESVIDGLVNWVGNVTYQTGRSLRVLQTGALRNYVMFIAVGVLGLFFLLVVFFPA